MGKLLHERLYEFAKEHSQSIPEAFNVSTVWAFAEKMADEIERDYVPRIRYDDDTPVQWDDDVEGCDGGVNAMLLFHDGSGMVYGSNDNVHSNPLKGAGLNGIKRLARKELDAEGVEYKVGEEIWRVRDGVKFTVVDLLDGLPGFINVKNHYGYGYTLNAKGFTHREPDSLEKLRDDMMSNYEDWDSDPNKWLEFTDRLTALIERGA